MTSVADTLRNSYDKGVTRPLAWRKHQLEQMVKMLEENESAFLDALATDLGKPRVEGFITDIAFVTSEVKSMIKKLKKWNKHVVRRLDINNISINHNSRMTRVTKFRCRK